jgi:Polysaccharide biosynthesis protein/Polysaccharide biosynthesis C-terminal domain
MKLLEEFYSQKPTVPLAHYTSASGLSGILSSKSLWATHIRFLNDSKEFVHAVGLAREYLKTFRSRPSTTTNGLLTDRLFGCLDAMLGNTWIVSFSEDGDLLSQWRGYCPTGGYVINFQPQRLEALAGQQQRFILAKCARNIDNVLIGAFMGTEMLGYYALAFQVVGLPAMVMTGSVYYTVFSGTSEAWRKGDTSPDHFLKALRGVSLLSAPVMVGIAVTAPLAIPFILGDKWLPTVPLLICLAPLGLVQAMWAPISGVLIGMGRSDLTFKLGLIGSTTTIAAIFFGILFSSTFVALGVSVTAILSWSLASRKAMELCHASFKGVLKAISAPLISALLMGCVVIAVQEMLFTALPLAIRLTASITVGILAYCLILIGWFHDHISDDMAMVKTALFSRSRSQR